MRELKEKTKFRPQEMFLNARQKSANDWEVGKKMLDTVIGTLGVNPYRIAKINECWHLHSGKWPEMDTYLGKDDIVLKNADGEGRPFSLNDFISHHGKVNNVTQFIMGDIITQPLIAIIKDYSSFGRKFREEEQVKKLKAFYYENVYLPQAQLIAEQQKQEMGNVDIMSLSPDEQKQIQADLQAKLKAAIPRTVMEDLKKVRTPDERIRQVLLNYDIKAYEIEEKFIQGGEEAVVAYEEYYRIGKKGLKPTFEVLNSKFTNWAGSENCDYSEDGVMATYDRYLTPHDFIMKHGRAVIEDKDFFTDVKEFFSEVPGYYRSSSGTGRGDIREEDIYRHEEQVFTEFVGENPGFITEDWRTRGGQQQIGLLYNALSRFYGSGLGIRETYAVWKWTEEVTYVQRYEDGKIEEYFFSADYKRDKSRDIMYRKFPANRVYHGTKIADKFYVGLEAVEWQYYGNLNEFEPKLTICGRRYARSNGNDEETTLIGPAIQAQLRYNITASKLEDLERNDHGKIMLWNTNMRPPGWDEDEYLAMMLKLKNVPFTHQQLGQDKNIKPFYVEDAGSSSKMEEYRNSMAYWENEIYKAMRVNRDALGSANQYQSNALTQSNIQGSQKQLLPFHNRRRLVKQRVLNMFSMISLVCLIEDEEKQIMLLDDFARFHIKTNADEIRANPVSMYIVDDYAEAQDVERIRGQVLTMMQQGTPLKDVIAVMRSKSVNEMYEVAEVAEIQAREDMADERNARMAELQQANQNNKEIQEMLAQKEEMSKERDRQVKLAMSGIESQWAYNAADVDKNKTADSLQKAREEIASREKVEAEKRQTELQRELIKARSKNKN